MKTTVVLDKEGRPFAFEVSNAFLTRSEVRRFLAGLPGAKLNRAVSLRNDEFCEVELKGKRFVAWEPFGDNSVFWIGPNPPEWNPDIQIIRDAFTHFRPFWGVLKWIPIVTGLGYVIYQFAARSG